MLRRRCREPGPIEGVEQVAFEVALRGPIPGERTLHPSLHECDSVFAAAPVSFQVGGHLGWSQEAEVPRVVGHVVEATLGECRSSESEQGSSRVGHDEARRKGRVVSIVRVPAASMDVDPLGRVGDPASRDEALDRIGAHAGEPEKTAGRSSREHAAPVEP